MADVKAAIASLPGAEGWWHSSGRETLEHVAAELSAAGLPDDTIIDVLARVFGAAAEEYGD